MIAPIEQYNHYPSVIVGFLQKYCYFTDDPSKIITISDLWLKTLYEIEFCNDLFIKPSPFIRREGLSTLLAFIGCFLAIHGKTVYFLFERQSYRDHMTNITMDTIGIIDYTFNHLTKDVFEILNNNTSNIGKLRFVVHDIQDPSKLFRGTSIDYIIIDQPTKMTLDAFHHIGPHMSPDGHIISFAEERTDFIR